LWGRPAGQQVSLCAAAGEGEGQGRLALGALHAGNVLLPLGSYPVAVRQPKAGHDRHMPFLHAYLLAFHPVLLLSSPRRSRPALCWRCWAECASTRTTTSRRRTRVGWGPLQGALRCRGHSRAQRGRTGEAWGSPRSSSCGPRAKRVARRLRPRRGAQGPSLRLPFTCRPTAGRAVSQSASQPAMPCSRPCPFPIPQGAARPRRTGGRLCAATSTSCSWATRGWARASCCR
jgi:hypothetical protein